MEEFKVIEEQEKVLKTAGKSVIVSASAGSGKTSLLIRKITDCITEQNFDISNLLILTYTNAAAGEMRDRLVASLIKYIEKVQDGNRIEYLTRQMDKFSVADISTFHSFYERLIKKYFYILGIDPSFKILSNEELLELKHSAFEEAINKFKEVDFEGYLNLADILGKKRKDNAIRDRILMIDEFLSSQFDKEKWLKTVATTLYEDKDIAYSILREEIIGNIDQILLSLRHLLKTCVEVGEEYLSVHLNECCSKLEGLKLVGFGELFDEINGSFSLPSLYKKKEIENVELFEEIKVAKKVFSSFLRDYRSKKYGDFKAVEMSFKSSSKNVDCLVNIYLDYAQILSEKKRALNSYDFSDLESFCYELLQNGNVRSAVSDQYKLIFVDEFQDINPIQYQILKHIGKDDNVFFVGDPKQSIYAFRQSEVDIFTEIFDEFSSKNERAFTLKSNFRSNKLILDFVNRVFDVLMTKDFSNVDYRKDARFEARSENSCDNNSVIVSVIKKVKNNENNESECIESEESEANNIEEIYNIFQDIPVKKDVALEAKLIAHQIGQVIKENIFDDKIRTSRKVNYRDIAILLRNRSVLLDDIIRTFKKYNIPFVVNDKIDLLSSKDVSLLVSLLKICCNRFDDINLSPVLASDFGELNYNQLALIKKTFIKEEFFYNCCEKYLGKEDEISKKLNEFISFINDIKFYIQCYGIEYALNYAMRKKGIFEKIKLKDDGEFRCELVEQFLKFIVDSGFNQDLFKLINFLENNRKIIAANVKKCELNAVNITTIHSSKGLEFPVVFLADAGRDLSKAKPETTDIKINKKLGIALKNYDETERKVCDSIFERIINLYERKKETAENVRLLYVALTRAKNKLFISGEIDKKIAKINGDFDLLKTKPNCYINYMLGVLQDDIEKINSGIEFSKDGICFQTISEQNFKIDQNKNSLNLKGRVEKIKASLEKLNFSYKFESQTKLAKKTTVTKIVTAESNGMASLNSEPQNYHIKEHLRGETDRIDKGILIHNILEKVDLSLHGEGLKNEIEKRVDASKLNEVIDREKAVEIIEKNIYIVKKLIPKNNRNYYEKQFMLKASLKDIYGEEEDGKMLIQGKIDLLSLGEKNLIIDYKYSSINSDEIILKKYSRQLKAYAYAVEKALAIKLDGVYILNLINSKLIPVDR
jgi:ATP-dependent helicase/nuclease subunit A